MNSGIGFGRERDGTVVSVMPIYVVPCDTRPGELQRSYLRRRISDGYMYEWMRETIYGD